MTAPETSKTETRSTIPDGWTRVAIGALARFSSGQGISVSALHGKSSDYPIPVYGGNGIAGYSRSPLISGPTVVVGRVGQRCGEVYFEPGPAWISDNALYPSRVLRPLDLRFFGLALQAAGLNDVKNRNDLPLVTQAILHDVTIAWPIELSEQRAIATALGDLDTLVAGIDNLITKKRDLKRAVMQQLLTGQTRLPGFRDNWETRVLGKLGSISGGGVDKKIRPGEPAVRLVNFMDVYRRNRIYSKDLDHVVSASTEQVTRCAIRKGDIFFTPSSEMPFDIALSAVAMEDISDACYSYHVVRLRLDEDWDPTFRAYAFKSHSFLTQAARACEGSGVRYVVTLAKFRELSVHYPTDRSEQAAIGAVLSDIDAELAALEARRDKTLAIKQGMMQELLTGKTRLV